MQCVITKPHGEEQFRPNGMAGDRHRIKQLLGVAHASELWIEFGTYDQSNATAGEEALSKFIRGTWAQFAKDPKAGPGWNAIGTGAEYLDGADDLDVALLGSEGNAGVKIIQQQEVDARCAIWAPILAARI